MRNIKNIANGKIHIASTTKSGYTLCGRLFTNGGFAPQKLIDKNKVTCKTCAKLNKKQNYWERKV